MRTTTSTYQQSLASIARIYTGLQQSIIPIYGDCQPDRAKVAATNWKIFQTRIAPAKLIDHWFLKENHGGLAIVTGRISNLIVLDFDTQDCEEDFRARFPHLINTRIIRSAGRGLSHYYYNTSTNINLPTLHIDGADLLSNGAYAVAPPTIINNNAYEIVNGGRERLLTQHDSQLLYQFFKQCNDRYTKPLSTTQNKSCQVGKTVGTSPAKLETEQCSEIISSENLLQLYQHYAPQIGRNNALFKVACYGRDRKLSQLDVTHVLKIAHAEQLSIDPNTSETYQSRLHEAENTIASAFSQPPKPLVQNHKNHQLTNSIREALLKQGLTCVARVLDGLFLKGFKSGDIVTKKIVMEALQGQVGRHSILKTFSAILDSGKPVFKNISPSPRTSSHTSVAKNRLKESNKKCFLFGQSKPNKTFGGRIPTQYRIPEINILCRLLDVPYTQSDKLCLADVKRAKTYRQAVHRELIKRRPGMYYRDWLASRLGVSKRTSQRYDTGAEIQKQAMYIHESITWDNVDIIPVDEPIAGKFIETKEGKRYPPLRQIATTLLARKQSITYCYQDANYYWYDDNLPIISVRYGENPKQHTYDEQLNRLNANIKGYWADLYAKKHVKDNRATQQVLERPRQIIDQLELRQDIKYTVHKSKKVKKSKRFYKKELPDSRAEALAKRLYQAIWERATTEKSRLSLVNARKLIDKYSEKLIHRALGLLKYRKNINNPAGFIIVWLRSTNKATIDL